MHQQRLGWRQEQVTDALQFGSCLLRECNGSKQQAGTLVIANVMLSHHHRETLLIARVKMGQYVTQQQFKPVIFGHVFPAVRRQDEHNDLPVVLTTERLLRLYLFCGA